MKQRPRIYYTESQKALMWERWQQGESLQHIAQLFDRNHSSIQRILAETGGIRPPQQQRSRLALSLAEREEISRGLVAGHSMRSIARLLRRAPSTISREINRNDGPGGYRAKPPGIGRIAPRPVNWCSTGRWRTSWRISSNCSGRRSRLPDG
jgi:IS30 family transposase